MKTRKRSQKVDIIEIDELDFDREFDEVYAKHWNSINKMQPSTNTVLRRRATKRKLDLLKEKKWFKQNYWIDDDCFADLDGADAPLKTSLD